MDEKEFFLVVYGKNQVPFPTLDSLVEYFKNSGNLFDAIMDDVRFYRMTIKPIDSPLNNLDNE